MKWKVFGMKSNDCHVFLQMILPLMIQGLLKEDVGGAVTELYLFFWELCSGTWRYQFCRGHQKILGVFLQKLEMIFSLVFFTVMMYLTVHLPREEMLTRLVQYKWIYPVERLVGVSKCFVKNKAHPKGSITEGYIENMCSTFCFQNPPRD